MEGNTNSFKNKELKKWNIEDSKNWILEFKKKSKSFENIDFTKFEMDGEILELLTMSDFQKMSIYGIPLYRYLYSFPKNMKSKKIKNANKLSNNDIDKELLRQNQELIDNLTIENDVINKSVLVRIGTHSTFISFGGGVRIGRNLILCSKHVVNHPTFPKDKLVYTISICSPNRWVTAKLLDSSQDNDHVDLALLEIIDLESNHSINLSSISGSGDTSNNKQNNNSLKSSESGNSNDLQPIVHQQHDNKQKLNINHHNAEQEEDNEEGGSGSGTVSFEEKSHTINSSEFTNPSFDYHHLQKEEKEREKTDFQSIISIKPIEFNNPSDGMLTRELLLVGYPKERLESTPLMNEFKVKIDSILPSIEKNCTVAYCDSHLLEVNSVFDPGYSSSILFIQSPPTSNHYKFVGFVKSNYMSNPTKYYATPTLPIVNWLNSTIKKNNIKNLSF